MTCLPSHANRPKQAGPAERSAGGWAWTMLGALCLAAAVALGVAVHDRGVLPMDVAGYDWIAARLISPGLTPVVLAITRLASAVWLIALAAALLVVLAVRRRAAIGAAIALNLACVAALNEILKSIMCRPRPSVTRLAVEHGFSFPSGHAMASTAFYGFLIYLIHRYMRDAAAKWTLIALLALLVPVIMATRVYLGVHYVSDVLAGCLCSIAWLTLLWIPLMRRTLLRDAG